MVKDIRSGPRIPHAHRRQARRRRDGPAFDNINPATEEVIGSVADGTRDDMERAVAAARHAFDETDWSTDNGEFRQRCLRQLQAALESEREELRAELVAEVGCAGAAHLRAAAGLPLKEASRWPAEHDRASSHGSGRFPTRIFGMGSLPRVGVEGAGRRRRRDHAVELPVRAQPVQARPDLATGNTVVLKPAPDTPWNATRIGRLIAEQTDIPAGVVNVVTSSDHLVGEVLADVTRAST